MQNREVVMRTLLNTGWVLLMTVALALALAGCGAEANSSLRQPAPALGKGFDLPAPSSLRIASDAQIKLSGKDYHAAWAHNRVAVAGNNARYSPQYADANRTLSDAAYAIYALDVSSFTGSAKLFLSFETAGQHGDAWVGLADYPHDRWDWEMLSGPVDKQGQLLFDLAGKSSAGVMPVALVFIGTDTWELVSLYLGDAPEPGSWPMAGQNTHHTYHAADPGAQSANMLWKFQALGPGTKISSMAAGPDGALYVGAGDELVAFDPQGKQLWECFGVTPKSAPVIGPDGSIYVGGDWPNAGLHMIGSDGVRKMVYWTDFGVLKSPALLPDGTICFATSDHKLWCIYPSGNLKWQYSPVGTISSSPAVDADGVIYIGVMTADFQPVCYLLAINPDGTLKWSASRGSRTRPAIAPDGTIVSATKKGEVFAVNPDGTEKWVTSGANAYTWPVIGANGAVYVSGNSITALSCSDGSPLWSTPLTGMATGGPGLSPDGKTLSVATDSGQIFMCDTNGTPLTSIETGGEFWVSAVAANGVGYFADTNYYITACNRDGSIRWRGGVGGRVLCSPVTSMDGTVYFGSEDHSLYAIWPDGRLKWRYQTGGPITASPLVLPDGTVLVGSMDHKLHAVSPEGAALWQFETGDAVEGSPTLGPDGRIYFGSDDRSLYAIYEDETVAWSFPTGWKVTGAPTVDNDGQVYFGSWDSYVYRLNSDGTKDWSYLTKGPVKGSVAVSGDMVYTACEKDSYSGRIDALTTAGKPLWSYTTGCQVSMSPTVGDDGTVYVMSKPGQSSNECMVYAIRNRTLRWSYAAPSAATGMALDANGVLFAGTADGRVLALDDSGSTMAVAWTYSGGPANFFSPAIAGSRTYIGYDTGIYAFGDN
jgi:outer membrane protein assembly factor BamB